MDLYVAKDGVLDDDEQRSLVQALGLFEQAADNLMVREEAIQGSHAARVRLAQSALDDRSPGLARVFISPLPDDHTERSDLLQRAEEQTKQLAAQRKLALGSKLLGLFLGALKQVRPFCMVVGQWTDEHPRKPRRAVIQG